jgi:acetolactate synthase-1/2/3 large subunit
MKQTGKRTGAQALVESLEKAGTEVLFGYPGGSVLDIFNVVTEAKFQFVLGRHEQGSVHMADGYARSVGKPGVCLVTSGPGATNTITGLATANMDGIPLVLITGQVPLGQIGTDAFQEADTTGITRGVCKHNFLVHSADEIPEIVAQAFYIATHGKPGPVVIDIPKNCQQALTDAQYPERVSLRAYHPESMATTAEINRLAKLINGAKRPVIYAGGGVISSGAAKDVAALARRADIPVATTLMGLGAFDERDPLSLRLAGMHGTWEANKAIDGADLLLALGVRFNDRITGKLSAYARKAKIVHIDCDPASIGKNVPVTLGIVADVKDVLTTVLSRITSASHAEWRETIEGWRREHAVDATSREGLIHPRQVIEAIDRATEGRAVVVTDVGQHQMFCAQHFRHNLPRHFLTSGGMGSMGFGIPAAIGAAFARPDHATVAVCGDGGAQMTFEELVVAVEHKLPVTFVVLNNGCLGMVRQWQELFYGRNYSGSITSVRGRGANERLDQDLAYDYLPDFVKLADAHGAEAVRVIDPAKLDRAVRRAIASRKPTLIEVIVDPRANVYPMIPGGKPVSATVFGR